MSRVFHSRSARRLNNRFATVVVVAMLPGLVLLGWRVLLVLAGVLCVSTLVRRLMLQQTLPKPGFWPMTLPVDAMLLVCLLSAELAGGSNGPGVWNQRWPVIAAAGVLLVLLQRLRSAAPWPVFDPVVATIITLHLMLGNAMSPTASLQRGSVLLGDVVSAERVATLDVPWYERNPVVGASALKAPFAAAQLDEYLAGRLEPSQQTSNLDSLIRDELPPLEDLALGGQPMLIGQASGMALIGIILWAAYRRTIDWRVPVISLAVCYITLIILPTPTSILPAERIWRLFPSLQADIGVETGITFVHYLLFSSSAIFSLGLLATRGDVKPLHGRAIAVWSIIVGILTAAGLLYVSVTTGPFLALLIGPSLARLLDRLLSPRPMVLEAE